MQSVAHFAVHVFMTVAVHGLYGCVVGGGGVLAVTLDNKFLLTLCF